MPTFTSPFSPSDFLSRSRSRSRSLSLLLFFLLTERSLTSRLRSLSLRRSLSLSLSLFFSFLCLQGAAEASFSSYQCLNGFGLNVPTLRKCIHCLKGLHDQESKTQNCKCLKSGHKPSRRLRPGDSPFRGPPRWSAHSAASPASPVCQSGVQMEKLKPTFFKQSTT